MKKTVKFKEIHSELSGFQLLFNVHFQLNEFQYVKMNNKLAFDLRMLPVIFEPTHDDLHVRQLNGKCFINPFSEFAFVVNFHFWLNISLIGVTGYSRGTEGTGWRDKF